ncbi:MAG: hypothetical protein JSW27_10035 [Phycisphaerales bacterium]|nr:MAG: hypothetical protein JSW27_10035 [Phycisphaerales bacterium]
MRLLWEILYGPMGPYNADEDTVQADVALEILAGGAVKVLMYPAGQMARRGLPVSRNHWGMRQWR